MASRITGSIIKSSSSTDTAVTISATGRFTYRSGTYGYTVDGYIQIGSSKKSFNDARSSTSGGTFTAVSHSVTIPRTRVNQTITITLYGYCDEGSSEDKSTVTTTVVVPALPSYAVTLDYNDGETPIGNLTKWYGETLTLPTPARSGYTFLGWSDGTTNIGATYAVNAAASLTAQWKINNIPPSITNKNCQRVTGDKTQASFTVGFSAGKNADGSPSAVTSVKIEYKLSSASNWTELITVNNPSSSPITYTGGSFLETETYSIRYTISDANYSGLTATDVLTKVSYIWRAKKGNQGFDFGVPVYVNGVPVMLEGDIPEPTDYVIEENSHGIYKWRKWNSGRSELWAYWHGSNTHYSTFSGWYARYFDWSFPEGVFINPMSGDDNLPNAQFTAHVGSGFSMTAGISYNATPNTLRTYVLSSASGAQTCSVWMYCTGTWK